MTAHSSKPRAPRLAAVVTALAIHVGPASLAACSTTQPPSAEPDATAPDAFPFEDAPDVDDSSEPDATTGPCRPGSCDGCCNQAGECVLGTSLDACGAHGLQCFTCPATNVCADGACAQTCAPTDAPCPTGCCIGGLCAPGNNMNACGQFGNTCEVCATGLCYSGACCTPLTCGQAARAGMVQGCESVSLGCGLDTVCPGTCGSRELCFQTSPPLTAPGGVISLFAADFDGDGRADLAALGISTITVFRGRGDGTFSDGGVTPLADSGPAALTGAAADFNGDGRADLVLAGGLIGMEVWLAGKGSFTPGPALGGEHISLAAAQDLNGDGHVDVVGLSSHLASVWLGQGNGSFDAPLKYQPVAGGTPSGLTFADLDGDGHPDMLVSKVDSQAGRLSVLFGKGDGFFGPAHDLPGADETMAVAALDANGDGVLDLVTAGSAGVELVLGEGHRAFRSGTPLETAIITRGFPLGSADFNGDGLGDVVLPEPSDTSAQVLLGKATGAMRLSVALGTFEFPATLAIADWNGDGRPDLAVASNGPITVLINGCAREGDAGVDGAAGDAAGE